MRNKLRRRHGRCTGCENGQGPSPARDSGRRLLTQVANGRRCRVKRHCANGAIRRRLLDLGFVPDAEVEMVRCATLGDPLELRLGDYYVTLRKCEAELIEVQEG